MDLEEHLHALRHSLENYRELPPLCPHQTYDADLAQLIEHLPLEKGSMPHPESFLCGLHLWNDDLDSAHKIANDIKTDEGIYWRALIHRREKDYLAARSCFSRLSSHPIQNALLNMAKALLHPCHDGELQSVIAPEINNATTPWNWLLFVDWCERYANSPKDSDIQVFLRRMQSCEIILLLHHSLGRNFFNIESFL